MLLLAMTACSSPNPHDTGCRPQRAAMPPADYVHISSADVSDSKTIQIGVNTDLIGSDEADAALSLHFGVHFPNAGLEEGRRSRDNWRWLERQEPDRVLAAGAADAEVQSAANLIANLAPDRRNMVGRLFRSPDRRYLLLIEFEMAAGANALYFDITNWAKDRTES